MPVDDVRALKATASSFRRKLLYLPPREACSVWRQCSCRDLPAGPTCRQSAKAFESPRRRVSSMRETGTSDQTAPHELWLIPHARDSQFANDKLVRSSDAPASLAKYRRLQ